MINAYHDYKAPVLESETEQAFVKQYFLILLLLKLRVKRTNELVWHYFAKQL